MLSWGHDDERFGKRKLTATRQDYSLPSREIRENPNEKKLFFSQKVHFSRGAIIFFSILNFMTRIKATRCETLRAITTNNSKKHAHLTYCLNVSFMVQKGTAIIFSTSEPILLIVHENDLF